MSKPGQNFCQITSKCMQIKLFFKNLIIEVVPWFAICKIGHVNPN